jgi:lipopolysaccharide/colanic/teichoic acid biosynthesis glycosyltransferase
MIEPMAKRIFDFLSAFAGLVVLAPFLLALSAVILLTLGPPVFFCQRRPGRGGRIFKIWKFRTMTNDRGADGTPLPDEMRLTRLGRFLRSTSLDEFPELWNVVNGDMSLVGPRPLLVSYLERYTPEEARRHEVRPGITGWAQVNGRNATSWEERLRMDVWYVDHRSFWLDLRILLMTVSIVLNRKGINSPLAATMPELRARGGDYPRQGRSNTDNAGP